MSTWLDNTILSCGILLRFGKAVNASSRRSVRLQWKEMYVVVSGAAGKGERAWQSSAESSLLLIPGHVRSVLKQFIFICRLVYKKQH